MGVITGISQGIKIAKRVERRYRYLDPTNKFIRKFVPPPYRARTRQIKDILITGGVIYDPVVQLFRAFQKKPQYQQNRQARSGIYKPSGRFFKQRYYSPYDRRRSCRQERRY